MIDYGHGLTNIDIKTGVRYGVIHHNEIGQTWYDDSEPQYLECEEEDSFYNEPTCFIYNEDGYKAEQSFDDCDIFITLSPYYTLCEYCSPCAPGAGYIMSQNPDGIKAYCFGHDWFESGKAPYKVYSVKTDEEVLK